MGGRGSSPVIGRLVALPLLAAAAFGAGCTRPREPFRVAASYALTSLDPGLENTVSNFAVLSNVYEPLVATDADMRVRPCLARSWENPDPLTWILHLRPGVTFHSGRPLRAADVVYTVRRLLDGSEMEMRGYVLTVAEVEALDESTIRLRTSRPVRILLNKLHFVLVVPEGSTPAGLLARPDGTGPFRVEAWQGGELRLLRHDAYWGQAPRLERATFRLDLSPEQALASLLEGKLQLLQAHSRAVEERAGASSRHRVLHRENIYMKYLGYDLGREVTPHCPVRPNPFRNREVRRALHAAIDRGALVAALPGPARPATQGVPRFIFGFAPSLPEPVHDPARARELLASAGLGGGFEVTLHARRMLEAAGREVQRQWGAVGVRVRVAVLDDPAFFDAQGLREMSLWISRYGCPTGDASDLLDNVLHSVDAPRHYGTQNEAGYSDPALDRAIERAGETEGVEERRQILQAVLAQAMQDLPMMPLYTDLDVYAVERGYSFQPRNDSYIRLAEVGRE